MKKYTLTLLLTSLLYFLSISPSVAGSVSGKIEAPKRVKKLIVYLSKEPSSKQKSSIKVHTISQKNTEFNPPLTIISKGDSVEWENNESKEIDHNIFSLSPLKSFDLGLGAKNSKLSQQFKKTGVLNYYCSVHKNMEGKIVILPSRHYQTLDKATQFKIENLPKGKWVLNAIVFHRRYKAEPIKLDIGNDAVTDLTLKIIKR